VGELTHRELAELALTTNELSETDALRTRSFRGHAYHPRSCLNVWLHFEPAVDGEHGAGNVAGFVFQEEPHTAGDFRGLAEPPDRHAAHDGLEDLLGHGSYHLGFYETGCDAVHRDPFPGELQCQALREAELARFRRRVVCLADVARLADDGADVHDAPAASLEHVVEHRLHHVEAAREVHSEHGVPVIDRHLPDGLVDVDAGVVDQEVDPTLLVQHLFDDAAAGFGRRDIALMDRHRPALRTLVCCKRFCRFLVAIVASRHMGAGVRETLGDRRADAAAPTGHECNFALEHGGLLTPKPEGIIVLSLSFEC